MNIKEIDIEKAKYFIERLNRIGITPIENPTDYHAYIGQYGSVANYKKVTLGKLKYVSDPCGDKHLGVFVNYIAASEAGEDLCDYYIHEKRTLTIDDLFDWLKQRGIY